MTTAAHARYPGHRFPPEIISQAVWLYLEREDILEALRYAAWRAQEREVDLTHVS